MVTSNSLFYQVKSTLNLKKQLIISYVSACCLKQKITKHKKIVASATNHYFVLHLQNETKKDRY